EFIAKSPLPGIYGDANAGGFFGPELQFAGYDFIVLEGKASRPVFLMIQDDLVEIRDALLLWGMDTFAAEATIQKALGDYQIKVAGIGPAGENLVRFAAINVTSQRSAARAGLGAVMGSKNLKAVAVRGTKGVKVAKGQEFLEFARQTHLRLRNNEIFPAVSRFGTPGIAALMNLIGRFPTKNFQFGHFEHIDEIDAEALRDKFFVKNLACFNCPVACDKIYRVNEGQFAGTTVKSLEYETLNAFGAGVFNANLASIIKGNDLADRLGLDTVSAGRAVSFAMELYEKGLLTRAETDGLDLEWGNYETVLALLKKIAYRDGLGNLLAEGVRRAARAIGRGAEYYAMEVKGQELAAQDGRAQQSMGLAHATSNRGADHLKAFPTIDETGYPNEGRRRYGEAYLPEIVDPLSNKYKAFLVKDGEDYGAVIDSLGNCKSGGTFVMAELYWDDMAKALELASGMPVTAESLKRTGERIYNLQRAYNIRHGISRKDDTLPRRLLTEPSPSQRAKGHVVRLEVMLEEYYRLRQWDPATGIPTRAKLEELGLAFVADFLGQAR
ncbi:MAG: aldehyde ferredoxin oxidoreductase family protein, partial [Firmicutes bacterium]|nr:aldehyde ferredoxin oxidoreductase family protein [Bacillota bacterium]